MSDLENQDKFLHWLYYSRLGKMILPLAIKPAVTRLGGAVLNSRLSRRAVPGFIRNNGIDMSQFEEREFTSYNDFFTRKIKPGARPICNEPGVLVSPCDSVLSAYPVASDSRFEIKGTEYTMEALLRDPQLAQKYVGGAVLVFRLTVCDYHRYCYPASGQKTADVYIPGVFNTVNPLAAAAGPIYKENTRVRTVLQTDDFGNVLVMEVGALMVGKIVNEHPEACAVERGTEKGRFEFGGSTIIVVLEPGAATVDPQFFTNSAQGIETPVRYGQKVAWM